MAHARQPLSPCLRERGQIIFQSVTPFPLFFFPFFFFSPLLSSSLPSFLLFPTTEPRGLDTAVRSLEGWRGREWDESLLLPVFGSWFIFFPLSLSPPFFLFSIPLSLWGADYPGKIEFLQREDGKGGVRN